MIECFLTTVWVADNYLFLILNCDTITEIIIILKNLFLLKMRKKGDMSF